MWDLDLRPMQLRTFLAYFCNSAWLWLRIGRNIKLFRFRNKLLCFEYMVFLVIQCSNTKKILYPSWYPEDCFLSRGLLTITENSQCPSLTFHARVAEDTSGTLPSSITSDWNSIPRFPKKRPSIADETWICRLGFIYGSCMMVLRHILFLLFGNSWTTCFYKNG